MLWRTCNLTSFSPCLTGPVDYPFASRHKGPGFKSPGGGVLMWNQDSPVSVVSLHWWPWRDWSLWPHPEPSIGPRAENVIIPLDLTQLSCPSFTLAAGLPSSFTTDGVGWWGRALWRSLQSHFILTMSHWSSGLPLCFPSQGTQVQTPEGYFCETGILLVVLSCYNVANLHCM
jgi:hypothetical protein